MKNKPVFEVCTEFEHIWHADLRSGIEVCIDLDTLPIPTSSVSPPEAFAIFSKSFEVPVSL